MTRYDQLRACVYDRVSAYRKRQQELCFLEHYLATRFADLDVAEVAAGTSYWSQFISSTVRFLLATDITAEALWQIPARKLSKPVNTRLLSAYQFDQLEQKFSAAFSGLWFSHIPKDKIGDLSTHRISA